MTWSFKLAIAADCVGILVAVFFLISDFFKQSSSSNGPLTLMVVAMSAWVGLCFYLHSIGKTGLATTLAWIPAFPLLGYGLMLLAFIIFGKSGTFR